MGDGTPSPEAVGGSGILKYCIKVGARSIIVLPTILSKITVSSCLIEFDMYFFSLPPPKKELSLNFRVKIRSFSLFPFYFLPLSLLLHLGQQESKKSCKSLLFLEIYLSKLGVGKFQFIYFLPCKGSHSYL